MSTRNTKSYTTGPGMMAMALRGCALAALLLAALPACAGRHRSRDAAQIAPNRIDEANRLATQADRAAKAGDIDGAIDLYRQAIAAHRELAYAWNNLGVLYMKKDNYLDAAEAFKIASELWRSDPRPERNLGALYMKRGWAEEALVHYEAALERAPRDLESLHGAIEAGHRLGKEDELQLERVRTAILIEPDEKWRRKYEWERVRLEERLARASR